MIRVAALWICLAGLTAGIAACGSGAGEASVATTSPPTRLVGTPIEVQESSSGPYYFAGTLLGLAVEGKEPVTIDAVALEGLDPEVVRLAPLALPGGRESLFVGADSAEKAWLGRRPGARPAEGLVINPGRVTVFGNPSRDPKRATEAPWNIAFGFRVQVGRSEPGTAIIAYHVGQRREVLRVRLKYSVRRR